MVVAAVLAGATAFIVSSLQSKVYEGKTTLIVGQSLSSANPDYTQFLVAQGLSETYAAIAETRPILERVIEELGLKDTPGYRAGCTLVHRGHLVSDHQGFGTPTRRAPPPSRTRSAIS